MIRIDSINQDPTNPKMVIVEFSYTIEDRIEKSALTLPLTETIQEDVKLAVKNEVERRRYASLFELAKTLEGLEIESSEETTLK